MNSNQQVETQSQLFFDIGANVGAWALENINYCDKIVSVEASPITYNTLKTNCDSSNIIVLNYAVTNSPEEYITFYHAHCDVLSTTNIRAFTNPESRFYNYCPYQTMQAKTITLDRLIELYGVPDLLKIDVESAEFECISSLSRKIETLCFEWAAETHDITFKCLKYLNETLGYEKFYIQFRDNYTFRPKEDDYVDYHTLLHRLMHIRRAPNEKDWGMIWCK